VQQFFYGIPWSATALTMAKAIAYYWKIVLWPTKLQMNYDFSDFPVAGSLVDAEVLVSLLFLVSLIALALWLFRRDRTLSYFILWPFIALLPVMNIIVPTGVLIAVRLLYLPMVGYSVLLAFLLILPTRFVQKTTQVIQSRWHQFAFFGYSSVVLLLLASLTFARNLDFKDTKTLFRKDLLLSPDNVLSIKFLAPELPSDEAEPLLLRALKIRPSDSALLSLMGGVYEKKGDHATAESLQRRSLAIERSYRAHKQLGIVLSNTGRYDEAEEQFRAVIELKPYWSTAYEDLAIVLLRRGERELAFRLVQQALSLNPDSAVAYNLTGVYYKEEGNFEKSAAAFQRAADLFQRAETAMPGYFEALFNLADVSERLNPDLAVRAWTNYIRAAESISAEQKWVRVARTRVAALSQGQYRH
jgi:tetratricopeptide (TPR) repeat protein